MERFLVSILVLQQNFINNIGFQANIFPTSSLPQLEILAEVGLLLFMFIIGLEVDVNRMKRNFRYSAFVSIAGVVVPFIFGIVMGIPVYSIEDNSKVSFGAFILFYAVVMTITAFPVLARILAERRLLATKIGIITLACAAIDDVIAWCSWALIYGVIRSSSILSGVLTTLCAIVYIVIMLLLVRPMLAKLNEKYKLSNLSTLSTVFILLGLLFSSCLTQLIGIHEIFGAFVWGLVLPRERKLISGISQKIEDVTILLLLPLYFTYSGLRTSIGLLNSGKHWAILFLTLLATSLGKIVGCTFTARFTAGLNWRESLSLGVLMNTKGLVALIILNIGFEISVISETMFTMLVIVSLLTTVVTSPLLHFIYPTSQIIMNELAKFGESFSILLCIPDDRTIATKMVVLSKFLVTSSKGRVYALRLVEVTDRPSVYMKMTQLDDSSIDLESSPYNNNNRHHKQNSSDEVLSIAMEAAEVAGIHIEPIKQTTINIEKDICSFGESQNVDLIVLNSSQNQAKELLQSYLQKSFTQNENEEEEEITRRNVSENVYHSMYVLENALNNVGIFIDAGLTQTHKRILFPYYGGNKDTVTLKLARKIAKNENIQILIMKMRSSEDFTVRTTSSPTVADARSPKEKRLVKSASFISNISTEDILLEDALKKKNISLVNIPPPTSVNASLSLLTSLSNNNADENNFSASTRINNQVDTDVILSELSRNPYDLLIVTLCGMENINTIKELVSKLPVSLLLIKQLVSPTLSTNTSRAED